MSIRQILAWLAVFTTFICSTGCGGLAPSAKPTAAPGSVVARRTVGFTPGQLAPDFTLQTAHGNTIRLSQYQGQPVLLNFFATWCGPCRSEMPGMQNIYQRYWKRGLAIVAVNLREDQSKVTDFGNEFKLTFPLALDSDGSVSRMYRVNSVPATFFIDSEGVVRSAVRGSMEEEDFDTEVSLLFRLASAAATRTAFPLAKQAAATPAPTLKIQPGQPMVEGCVNVGAALVRSGPGKNFPGQKELKLNQCASFDAQNAEGTWLRLAEEVSPNGERLWVTARYVTPKGNVSALPVEE